MRLWALQDLNLGPTDYESSRKGVIQSTPVQSQAEIRPVRAAELPELLWIASQLLAEISS